MGRKGGSKDKEPRMRRVATEAELARKAATKSKAIERKRVALKAAASTARAAFVRRMGGGTGGSSSVAAAEDDDEDAIGTNGDGAGAEHAGGGSGGDSEGVGGAEADDGLDGDDRDERPGNPPGVARPADVEAGLEDDEADVAAVEGVMAVYLKAVFDRVHAETKRCGEPQWPGGEVAAGHAQQGGR